VTLGQAERVLGTTLNISVGTGGEQTIKNGGRASNTTIDNGGWQLVSAGGAATGAIDNGIQFIFAGPTAAAEGRSGP
jgi:autotransporter passenger strand-loop-strand repeat protein